MNQLKPHKKDSWHPDLNNDKEGPHWDYNDGKEHKWRVYPDGKIIPAKNRGMNTYTDYPLEHTRKKDSQKVVACETGDQCGFRGWR